MTGSVDESVDTSGLAVVTLNNPAKLNAMTRAMWLSFADVWTKLSRRTDVRCVLVVGAGDRAFCPGNDIGEFEEFRSDAAKARALSEIMSVGRQAMLDCPHPVIAKIRGACVGGGLEIAAMCDMRIAAASARFGAPLNRLGLTMAYEEMLPIWRLTTKPTMFEFLVEGRIVDAAEARARGLVNRVTPDDKLDDEVAAAAARILSGPPLANRWHKQFFRRLETGAPLTEADHDVHYLSFETEDYARGYRAFLAKTTATFEGC